MMADMTRMNGWRTEAIACRRCGVGYRRGGVRPSWAVWIVQHGHVHAVVMYRLSRRAWAAATVGGSTKVTGDV
jgi:hypothetical protein